MNPSDFSYANLANLAALDRLYQSYVSDPNAVDPSWRSFFEGMALATHLAPTTPSCKTVESADLRIYILIEAYRKFGHLAAGFNPLQKTVPKAPEALSLAHLGFKQEELDTIFPTCGFLKETHAPLRVLIEALQKTYCNAVGIEYTGGDGEVERFIQRQIEPFFPLHLGTDDQLWILQHLTRAELFETFLHTKFVGQKRFSLEGCETVIPMLSALIETGAQHEVDEVILGMSHRGRLNVLANILNKSYAHIFHEFEDHYMPTEFEGTGDVKYHKGFVGVIHTTSNKTVDVTLVANASHLESVDPIVEGMTRAKQELNKERNIKRVVPILLHGDASIAGQGIVYETFQMSNLTGYRTGGTIHIIINNQVGFTTFPKDSRSTRYCSEIGHAFHCPIFHVNAEDPASCVRVAQLAIEIRQRFGCDVIIDVNGYRKYGHNESDEPTFTQPLEYTLIHNKPSILKIFRDQLIREGILTPEDANVLEEEFKKRLQAELTHISQEKPSMPIEKSGKKGDDTWPLKTQVPKEGLLTLARKFCTIPDNFQLHPKMKRLLQERLAMLEGNPKDPTIDWGMAEYLAYATLLEEKIQVRLSGQDVRRGTFSHRHALWVDQVSEGKYFPLSHLSQNQALFDVFNSPLSEYAVLGFEFGYSIAAPHALVIWEAQFGDFANGAQVMIDQYLSSSEQKWNLITNLTLLLPHGMEGQGPEHSSARIERFLQMSAQDNWRIANCSTPAQLFHLLRNQAHATIKKPLILFTPKVLLRHPQCRSSLDALTQGQFQQVIDDDLSPQHPQRLVFCSGKVYYDLLLEREKRQGKGVVLIRIEMLYPFPQKEIEKICQKYPSLEGPFWVQEEQQNMGAWEYIHSRFPQMRYIGRKESASPAAGSYALHKQQWQQMMDEVFT